MESFRVDLRTADCEDATKNASYKPKVPFDDSFDMNELSLILDEILIGILKFFPLFQTLPRFKSNISVYLGRSTYQFHIV